MIKNKAKKYVSFEAATMNVPFRIIGNKDNAKHIKLLFYNCFSAIFHLSFF